MTRPAIIYVVGADEDTQLLLWRAFSRTSPDCVLYFFSNGPELVEHVADTKDKPDLVLADSSVKHKLMPLWQSSVSAPLVAIPVGQLDSFSGEATQARSEPRAETCLLIPPVSTYRRAVQLVRQLRPFWIRQCQIKARD